MNYMGGKGRIANEILPIILKNRTDGQYFVDVMCGGCNVLDKVDGKRIGNDINKYLISMFIGLQKDYPRTRIISKAAYTVVRNFYRGRSTIEDISDFTIGWIGWMGSYNGRFYDGGYSGHCVGKTKRDYIGEKIRNMESQMKNLTDVTFTNRHYADLKIPPNSLLYCDPPYKGTKGYSNKKKFNHSHFWEWCREMKTQGHTIFISEYNAPEDFTCVWQKSIKNTMNQKITKKPVEKLFTI